MPTQTVNFVLSGLGGQGILFMTKVLAHAALHNGVQVLGAETHGMAQRGGSVIAHLRLGRVASSLVNTCQADYLLSLDEHEAYRNLPYLRRGGKLFVNAFPATFPRAEVRPYFAAMDITAHAVTAGRIALDHHAPLSSNLALMGFMAGCGDGPFSLVEIRDAIDRISPQRFKAVNLSVFAAGAAAADSMPERTIMTATEKTIPDENADDRRAIPDRRVHDDTILDGTDRRSVPDRREEDPTTD